MEMWVCTYKSLHIACQCQCPCTCPSRSLQSTLVRGPTSSHFRPGTGIPFGLPVWAGARALGMLPQSTRKNILCGTFHFKPKARSTPLGALMSLSAHFQLGTGRPFRLPVWTGERALACYLSQLGIIFAWNLPLQTKASHNVLQSKGAIL